MDVYIFSFVHSDNLQVTYPNTKTFCVAPSIAELRRYTPKLYDNSLS